MTVDPALAGAASAVTVAVIGLGGKWLTSWATGRAQSVTDSNEKAKVDLSVFQASVAELRQSISDLKTELGEERAARQIAEDRAEHAEERALAAEERATASHEECVKRIGVLEEALRVAQARPAPDH